MAITRVRRSAWVALAVSGLILFVGGGSRFAIGLTLKPIVDELGSGRGLIGLAVALFQLVSALALFASGRLADRMSVGVVLGGGTLVAGLGLGAMALVSEPWQIVALYGLLFAVGNGIASLIPIGVMLSRHFPERAGLANSVALTGMGLGQLVMMATLAAVLAAIGWRAVYVWLGLAHLAVLPLIVIAVSLIAPGRAPPPAGPPLTPATSSAPPAGGLTVAEAMRTRRFWLLLAVYSLCGFEDFFVSTHVVAFALDRGADALLAGNLLALMGLMALLGVLAAGASGDRWGPAAATLASFLVRIAVFALVLAQPSTVSVAAFALLFGATFLVTAPLTVVFVRDAFGTRHLGALTGLITMVHHIWGGLGALAGALLFDAEGSYHTILVVMLATSLAGALLALGLASRRG